MSADINTQAYDIELPEPPHRHPMSGEAIYDEASVRAAIQADRARRAAPVVWRFRFPTSEKWRYTEHGPNAQSRPELTWEALYAAPSPQGDAEPECRTCRSRGFVVASERTGESDFREWEEDCPVCGGAGTAPKHVQAIQERLEATEAKRHALAMELGAREMFGDAARSTPAKGGEHG